MSWILGVQESMIQSMESGRSLIIPLISKLILMLKRVFSSRPAKMTCYNKMGQTESTLRFIKGDVDIVAEPPDTATGVILTKEE